MSRMFHLGSQIFVLVVALCLGSTPLALCKSAVASFYSYGVEGNFTFIQISEDERVGYTFDFKGLSHVDGQGGSHTFNISEYYIAKLPISSSPWSSDRIPSSAYDACSTAILGDVFDPYHVKSTLGDAYNCSEQAKPGDCASGDLSGRFGGVTNENGNSQNAEIFGSGIDFSPEFEGITLFGEKSIIGRSIVLADEEGTRLICATIQEEFELEVGEKLVVNKVIARFEQPQNAMSGLQGIVSFQQGFNNLGAELGDVTALIRLRNFGSTASRNASLGFIEKPSNKAGCGIYDNPDEFDEADIVQDLGQFWFKLGSSKEILTISSDDLILDYSSLQDVLLLVFDAGDYLGCAEFGKSAVATFNGEGTGISGEIYFQQIAENFPVQVHVSLDNLNQLVNKYHVHQYPLLDDYPTLCSAGGDHLNSLGVPGGAGKDGIYACDNVTLIGCESGDLSGKHGGFVGLDDIDEWYVDGEQIFTGLNLFGAWSIVGRSIVIHALDGSRFACANVLPGHDVNAQKAIFDPVVSQIEGWMKFYQDSLDQGAESTVQIRVETQENASFSHNWHVHTSPVDESNLDDCSLVGGHFNPHSIIGGEGFGANIISRYKYKCSAADYYDCEVGDLANKVGSINIPGVYVYTAQNFPLSGSFSIAGRSIVIHDQNGTAPRIGCATLKTVSLVDGTEAPTSGSTGPDTSGSTEDGNATNKGGIAVGVIVAGFVVIGIVILAFVMISGRR